MRSNEVVSLNDKLVVIIYISILENISKKQPVELIILWGKTIDLMY